MPPTNNTNWIDQGDKLKRHRLEGGLNQYTFQVVKNPSGGNWFNREIAVHSLATQPENVVRATANRALLTQTLGGYFVDHYGEGLTRIKLSGTTGYKARRVGDRMMTGLEQVLHLYRDIYQQSMTLQSEIDKRGVIAGFAANVGSLPGFVGGAGQGYPMVYFFDWAMDFSDIVIITDFAIAKSVTRNKLYKYEISMLKIGDIGDEIYAIKDPVLDSLVGERRFGKLGGALLGSEAAQYMGAAMDLAKDIGDMLSGM